MIGMYDANIHRIGLRNDVSRHSVKLGMSTAGLLLRFQLWATQDNVRDLKKRYLFSSAFIICGLSISMYLMIYYLDPFGQLRQVERPAFFIVRVSLLVGLMYSLITMGFVYFCRSVGITNLYSNMLLLGVLYALLFEVFPWTGATGKLFLDMAFDFGSVVAVAWLSLRLDRLLPGKKKKNGGQVYNV